MMPKRITESGQSPEELTPAEGECKKDAFGNVGENAYKVHMKFTNAGHLFRVTLRICADSVFSAEQAANRLTLYDVCDTDMREDPDDIAESFERNGKGVLCCSCESVDDEPLTMDTDETTGEIPDDEDVEDTDESEAESESESEAESEDQDESESDSESKDVDDDFEDAFGNRGPKTFRIPMHFTKLVLNEDGADGQKYLFKVDLAISACCEDDAIQRARNVALSDILTDDMDEFDDARDPADIEQMLDYGDGTICGSASHEADDSTTDIGFDIDESAEIEVYEG